MDIELYLILSTAYVYILVHNHEPENTQRSYVKSGIETYFRKHGYAYDASLRAWTTQARLDEIARNRTQGAKDSWVIWRGKEKGK
jgi:hypothetical protein